MITKNFKSTLLLFGLISLFSSSISAQTSNQQSFSIDEILDKVVENSRAIKIEEFKLEASEYRIQDAKNNRLPDLATNASIDKASNFLIYDNGLFNSPSKHDVIHTLYSTNTNMYLNIYEGLKYSNTIKLTELKAALQNENVNEKTALLKLQAIHLFYDLYLQKEWEKLLHNDVEEKEHQLKEIKDFFELGIVLESDVFRAELELSKRRMTLIEIQNQQKKINQELNTLVGFDDEFVIQPDLQLNALPEIENFDAVLKEGLENAYAERKSNIGVEITENEYHLVKANNALKIGIGGTFMFSNPQIFLYPYNDSWYNLGIIGLKASYSFSELYKNKNKKAAAKIEMEESHEHHKKVQDEIRTKIYQDYLSFDEALKYISINTLNEEYAEENARILHAAYFNQTALITDLLDADVLVLKSKFELKQSHVNVFKSYYTLQFSQGKL